MAKLNDLNPETYLNILAKIAKGHPISRISGAIRTLATNSSV